MGHVKHGMLRNDVYNQLRNDILGQIYSDGESLAECKISTNLGVSRTPVREAFAQLHADGLVDLIPNKGVIVRGIHLHDIEDIYDVRVYIENLSVKRACQKATEANLTLLSEILVLEEDQIIKNDIVGFIDSDYQFHCGIMQLSGSYLYVRLLTSMMEQTRIARKSSVSSGERVHYSFTEHSEIYESIKTKDLKKAQTLMKKHLINAKRSFVKTMN